MTTDEQLILDFQQGSQAAFAELFDRYRQPVFGFFRRRLHDPARAEELAQETFLVVLRGIERYEPRAKLHFPAAQCDAALAALKSLGRVEQEQQGGEEVTAQVVDLDARLKNARETETRLQDILKTRTGKVSDVLEVEQQIAKTRQNIEQMEGEQKQLHNRITFSAITLELHEEYQASLETNEPSAGRRTRNAIVDGFRAAAEGALALLVFFLSAGPSLLLAVIILFWPARWAWRRFGNRPRHEPALAP